MFKPKSNTRLTPSDLDKPPPDKLAPVLEFDYVRCTEPGKEPWPLVHFGQKFGPSLIRKAWASGLVVYAEVDDIPYPIAVKDAVWIVGCLWVRTLEGLKSPVRLFTRANVQGLTASGLLMEEKETS